MSELKEYVVTLNKYEDLDQFYTEMETSSSGSYTPSRVVDCAVRREISRNTHYMLTDEEAGNLRIDTRVLAVELTPTALGMRPRPSYSQTSSYWSKSSLATNSHKNWGILRVFEGVQRSRWGSNDISAQTGTVTINAEGRNVDVVVIDGHFNPSHPEYAVNSDGTGGSRVNQYNWFIHNPQVTGQPAGTYVYTPYTGTDTEADNNHGAHVAGTIAGNTQGWARCANLYNLYPYSGTNPNNIDTLYIMDYVREFHRTKSINPETNRKNPTITNNSWAFGYTIPISSFISVRWRGTTYSGPFTQSQLGGYGLVYSDGTDIYTSATYPALDADVVDAIADGIIFVGAASNESAKIDVLGGTDYNNYFYSSYGIDYYHRGASPGRAGNVICVGAVSAIVNESKATFSNCGPRVDIFAPGYNVISSVNSGTVTDSRNSSYYLAKYSGTSMASPQVCGMLACALEIYPNLTQEKAIQYLLQTAKLNQMTNTSGGYQDYTDLQGAPNRYLAFRQERPVQGNAFPKVNYFVRPTSGAVYPRTRIRR